MPARFRCIALDVNAAQFWQPAEGFLVCALSRARASRATHSPAILSQWFENRRLVCGSSERRGGRSYAARLQAFLRAFGSFALGLSGPRLEFLDPDQELSSDRLGPSFGDQFTAALRQLPKVSWIHGRTPDVISGRRKVRDTAPARRELFITAGCLCQCARPRCWAWRARQKELSLSFFSDERSKSVRGCLS